MAHTEQKRADGTGIAPSTSRPLPYVERKPTAAEVGRLLNPDRNNEYKPPRFRAELRGQVLGWYDTATEANTAIDAARDQEQKDEAAEYEAYRP